MTLLFYDDAYLDHAPSDTHPEHPGRVRSCWRKLRETGIAERCTRPAAEPASVQAVTRCHDAAVVKRAEETCRRGGGYLDSDTPVERRSFDVALLAAGAGMTAVDQVLAGSDSNAFCLVRPPGHHATNTNSMGFCLFNNIAVAARHALDHHQLNRVMIIDWDVHHGNGTQDIFYDDPQVMFLSMHRYPFYPGTGAAEETGRGPGLGMTRNLPTPYDHGAEEILARFESALADAASACRPELVLLSAGFDGHYLDPIGGLRLDIEHFDQMRRAVQTVADEYSGGRLVSMLEGGYNVDILAECVAEHVEGLLASSESNERR